jgi:hypothetical protein
MVKIDDSAVMRLAIATTPRDGSRHGSFSTCCNGIVLTSSS